MFSSTQSLNKIENLQKRALRFLYDDFEASYEDLLSKGGKSKINVTRLRTLCVDGYKSLKVLGPEIWNNLPYHVKYSDNLDTFKNLLKNWDGDLCKCNLCKNDIY